MKTSRDDGIKQFNIIIYNTLHTGTFLIIHVLYGKICKMVLYTELFYAIIPACFHTFCCSVIPTSPYISNVLHLYTTACLHQFRVTQIDYGNKLLIRGLYSYYTRFHFACY